MIMMKTRLEVADNTGAGIVSCIQVMGGSKRRYGHVGDVIVGNVKKILTSGDGPCSFSQRQGYIYIDLKNGGTWELSPGSKHGHFKDQKGNTVVRAKSGDGREVFEWEDGRKITKLP